MAWYKYVKQQKDNLQGFAAKIDETIKDYNNNKFYPKPELQKFNNYQNFDISNLNRPKPESRQST